MRTVRLGPTDTYVSAIGYGAMQIAIQGRPPEDHAQRVLKRVLEVGITFIDTADAYCLDENDKHSNERQIAAAIRNFPGDTSKLVVATKGGLIRPDGRWERDASPEHLEKAIEGSFKAFGATDPIFLWQLHAVDPRVPIRESFKVIKKAVEKGRIRYVGVSNFSVRQIKEARGYMEIISVQNEYSPWNRSAERDGVLEYCETEKLTFLPWSPFGGKRRSRELDSFEPLQKIARERGVSMHRVVLAWLLQKSPCVLPIPGSVRPEAIEDCVAALELTLTPTEVKSLDSFGE